MKTIFIIMLMAATATLLYGQRGEGVPKKIRDLEKLKLLEVLQLDEETSIRFINRRNEHHESQRKLNEELEVKIEKLEQLIQEGKKGDELKKLTQESLLIEERLILARGKYINSLNDLLNSEQLAKMLVFERKFREEMRETFMRERGRRGPGR
jgi:hypothetical protein